MLGGRCIRGSAVGSGFSCSVLRKQFIFRHTSCEEALRFVSSLNEEYVLVIPFFSIVCRETFPLLCCSCCDSLETDMQCILGLDVALM